MTSIVTPQLASVASGTPATPVQPPQLQSLGQMIGQILTGTVIALLNDDAALRLQTPAGLLDVAAPTPLPSGTAVTVTVQGTAQQPQIVITPLPGGSQQPPAQQTEASDQIGPARVGTNSAEKNSAAAASANSSVTNVTEPAEQPSAQTRPAPPATQAALSTAAAIVRNAAATQGSLGALYADLEAAVTTPTPALPAPVLDAAKSLLAMRLDIGSGPAIAAGDVKTALMQSGLTDAASPSANSAPANTASNIGTALLALRQTLTTWLDQAPAAEAASAPPNPNAPQTTARAAVQMPSYRSPASLAQTLTSQALTPQTLAPASLATSAAAREQTPHVLLQAYPDAKAASPLEEPTTPQALPRASVPMPPFRGSPSLPQAPLPPSLLVTAPPREQALHLLAETDAAIARQTLLRIGSLPADQSVGPTHNNDNATRVMFEIPVATALGTGIAPMTIARDGGKGDTPETLTSWLATFSIDLAAIGPVHVRIALVGERASVTFSAERAQSAELLAAELPRLDAGLRSAQIEPGELRCRVGAGTVAGGLDGAPRQQAAAPGMFLDQAS
jgi:Flagellar hook-length control protein FliK